MNSIFQQINDMKIVPVIALDSVDNAAPLAEALLAGGITCAEVTFRTNAAQEVIRVMAKKYPELLVGAGTITSEEQVEKAVDAGARFIVSPGVSRRVIEKTLEKGLPAFPGVCTPTEIMMTLEYQLPVMKFFPAEQYGGLKTINALAAPFPQLKFMPTGGIDEKNIREYLIHDKVIACGGSWMVAKKLVEEKKFQEIEKLSRQAIEMISDIF